MAARYQVAIVLWIKGRRTRNDVPDFSNLVAIQTHRQLRIFCVLLRKKM
jgi:hypothetical protein